MENVEQIFPFWGQLSIEEKELLVENMTTAHYKKGEVIHRGDENCLGLLMIKKGCLCTYMLSEGGREVALFRLIEGDPCILSASCVLHQITFDVFIDAEEDTEAVVVNSMVLARLMEKNIYVQNFIYKMTVESFSDVMWTIQQILFLGFDKRLAIFLLDEASKENSTTIKVTHGQIAKYIGSAREVVSRMLKRFAEEGIVKVSRGEIIILDKSQLQKLIQ